MRLCIVGHGPSLLDAGRGHEIDAHDFVVRLKGSKPLLDRPKIYGSKVNAVMGSMVIAETLIRDWCVPEFWFFLDTRTHLLCPQAIRAFKQAAGVTTIIDRELCIDVIDAYMKERREFQMDARQERKVSMLKIKGTKMNGQPIHLSDDKGHLHPSAGTFAYAYALKHKRPKQLTLYGYDNVASGDFNWSVTRGPDWKQYPDHNWAAESRLVHTLAKFYGYAVEKQGGTICVSAM